MWQDALRLSVETYRITAEFPKHEIAEGKGRKTDREFAQFLFHARGSRLELETQIMIAHELNYVSEDVMHEFLDNAAKVGGSLSGLIKAITGPTTNDQRPTTTHV